MLLDEHDGDGVRHRFVSIASDAGAGCLVMSVCSAVGVGMVLDKGRRRMVRCVTTPRSKSLRPFLSYLSCILCFYPSPLHRSLMMRRRKREPVHGNGNM